MIPLPGRFGMWTMWSSPTPLSVPAEPIAYADTNSYSNGNGNGNRDGDSYIDTDANTYSNRNRNCDGYIYTYIYSVDPLCNQFSDRP